MAYELIETITLASSASSIEFTSIPQDGVDLLCVLSARHDSSVSLLRALINNDTGANYARLYLYGDGSDGQTQSNTGQTRLFNSFAINRSTYTADTFSNLQIYFPNYTSSSAKTISFDGVVENNATEGYQNLQASSWSGTDPISSISLGDGTNNMVAGTTASLYKIS